jgi:hypothetical protein
MVVEGIEAFLIGSVTSLPLPFNEGDPRAPARNARGAQAAFTFAPSPENQGKFEHL